MTQILVFCGSDQSSSRQAFFNKVKEFEEKKFEIVKKSAKEIDEEFLELISLPVGLFQNQRCLVTEQIFETISKNSKKKESLITKLTSLKIPVIDWEEKSFSQKEKTSFPQFKFLSFELPVAIFNFLENIKPNNPKTNYLLYQKALSQKDPEFIFYMLIKHLRNLLLVSENQTQYFFPWQVAKIKKQLSFFPKEKIIKIYHQLLEIDYQQKRSLLPGSLKSSLDLLISSL